MKICFIGGGSFGTALAVLLGNKGHEVAIYDIDAEIINGINNDRRNAKYLGHAEVPDTVTGYLNIEDAVHNSGYVVLAVPSSVIKIVCSQIKDMVRGKVIINIAKGIEYQTSKRLSEVIKDIIPDSKVAVLSGPSHAEEVVLGMPTTVVVSSEDKEVSRGVQDLFTTSTFRIYTNDDLVGVEIGGAAKNVMALAAGVLDGLGFGDNTKAALMTRGMKEIIDIGVALGGKPHTFYGLTGIGDLIVTCTSFHSRNRSAGVLLGKGEKLEDVQERIGMVIEGISACKAFYELGKKLGVDMPITNALYDVLFNGHNPKEAVKILMGRESKNEFLW